MCFKKALLLLLSFFHSSRAGCPFVMSQKDEKKFKEFLENPERLYFARRTMTAQRTKNTAFIEKRHNADFGLISLSHA